MNERLASTTLRLKVALALLAPLLLTEPACAGDYYGPRPLRYGVTSPWWTFDARNDDRDVPTNGMFPGNFAANPPVASIGSAGWLESNPYRSPRPYPSQVYFGPASEATLCARRHRAYDPASHTYLGTDGVRHVCKVAAR
jgi:hypothetical protein